MRFDNIEKFYEQNHQFLLEDNGRRSLRPTKSYTKDILACFEKFKTLYNNEGVVEHTKNEISSYLNVDVNTTLQNIRSMQEFGFLNGTIEQADEDEDGSTVVGNSDDNRYSLTPAFTELVDSNTNFGSYLYEKISKIRTLEDFTPYLNFLICTLREAAVFGDIVSFGPIGYNKYQSIVSDPEDRQTYRSRIFKIYGYCGRRSSTQSEKSDNYLPNISYMSIGTLEELGLIKKNKEKNNFGFNTYSLSYSGEYLLKEIDKFIGHKDDIHNSITINFNSNKNNYEKYITALRTKPFMLLAGISGTGKSRIVRELAFKSCSPELQDEKHTSPGNYCMIEVKPNWHDSTELFGYASSINRKYMVTPFMRFIVKAMQHPNTPFFVCLDEMNLAHVEQYFAEFLSVLETRKRNKEKIETSALIDAKVFMDFFKEDPSVDPISTVGDYKDGGFNFYFFKGSNNVTHDIFEDLGLHRSLPDKDGDGKDIKKANYKDIKIITHLLRFGMTIPENLLVVGTVNMDDTTKQFSRKVIDRAMTIEMNGGKFEDMFGNSSDLDYCEDESQILNMGTFAAKYISADDVIENCKAVKGNIDHIKFITGKNEDGSIIKDADTLPRILESVNIALKDTPFEVSYRVMNELVIYLGVLLDEQEDSETHKEFKECVNQAVDQILLMKVLPRIEGPYEMFVLSNEERNLLEGKNIETKLDWLKSLTSGKSKEKLEEMIKRLERQGFTRFWP